MDRFKALEDTFNTIIKQNEKLMGESGTNAQLTKDYQAVIGDIRKDYQDLGSKLKSLETKEPSFLELADQANIRKKGI